MSRLDTSEFYHANFRAFRMHVDAEDPHLSLNSILSEEAEPEISRKARSDIEGATCWRDPFAARCA